MTPTPTSTLVLGNRPSVQPFAADRVKAETVERRKAGGFWGVPVPSYNVDPLRRPGGQYERSDGNPTFFCHQCGVSLLLLCCGSGQGLVSLPAHLAVPGGGRGSTCQGFSQILNWQLCGIACGRGPSPGLYNPKELIRAQSDLLQAGA
ncbi:PREDICTED: heme transporter HRG1 isoform X5 [Condylura cristata]|uniref:heme transporter HRG1 isoform X5 n=1 Tax=Condylura cristata TaxID=143302 RepID=UPI000642E5AB|nr:PREDICTED: heme transporter HRG1 isoform X5 [Condylura cristata]